MKNQIFNLCWPAVNVIAHIANEMGEESAIASTSALEAALDLLRRLPPQNIEKNLLSLLQVLPEHTAELLNTVDVPTKVQLCPISNREFLACDYNRDGDSHRSPWSNEYEPVLEGGAGLRPSERLRKMEIIANEAFDTYRSLYYEGGVSSVYFWDVPQAGDKEDTCSFAAAVLLKKATEGESIRSGAWDAIHVVEVSSEDAKSASYKLTTTIILHLDTNVPKLDSFLLSGNVTRQCEQTFSLTTGSVEEYVANMGRMVEDMESRMRSSLQEIYFGKTHDVVNEIRPVVPAGFLRHQGDLQREMASRLSRRAVPVEADEAP